jgi:predicted transcriptional regulator
LREILSQEKDPPVCINTSHAELVERTMDRNFIPVTDDRNSFIGIVTRVSVMRQLVMDMKQIQYEELFDEQLETIFPKDIINGR